MSTSVPLLDKEHAERLPARAREVVEYRKSGLSLNHIQGCPLDCAYCIRHTYGLWDQRQPRALMADSEAVEQLVSHRYFRPHVTPVQVLNRATDPFLPSVRPHTLAVLADLDMRSLRNHVLVITHRIGRDRPGQAGLLAQHRDVSQAVTAHRDRGGQVRDDLPRSCTARGARHRARRPRKGPCRGPSPASSPTAGPIQPGTPGHGRQRTR